MIDSSIACFDPYHSLILTTRRLPCDRLFHNMLRHLPSLILTTRRLPCDRLFHNIIIRGEEGYGYCDSLIVERDASCQEFKGFVPGLTTLIPSPLVGPLSVYHSLTHSLTHPFTHSLTHFSRCLNDLWGI